MKRLMFTAVRWSGQITISKILMLIACGLIRTEAVSAQTYYPMIMSLKPVAIQVGATTEAEVNSRYTMLGTYWLHVGGTGVTGEAIPPEMPALKPGEKPKEIARLKLKFTVTPDALPGVREFRLAGPSGASTVGQLVVVRDPVIFESADNDKPEKAQPVALPAALCGVIEKAEDSDFWKFSVEAGQLLTFHTRCQRLQDKIHDLQVHADPILFLRDPKGNLLAMSDNAFFADPCIAYRFDQTGEYLLELRDVRYQGNPDWTYCIEANSRPLVTGVFPKAVKPGVDTSVELSGMNLPANPHGLVRIAAGESSGLMNVPVIIGDQLSNPVGVYVTELPITVEGTADNNTAATALPVEVPQVIAGRIETPSDLDCYLLVLKKGEKITFEVIARRQMSNLDAFLRILNEQGQPLREDDDGVFGRLLHADTFLESWEAPADGKYIVEIRDGLLRGGMGFEYALKLTRSEPYYLLQTDSDKTQLTPGTYGSIFARIVRKNGFAGEVQLHIDGLPAGVTATCGKILKGKNPDGCINLYADPDLKPTTANVRIWGTVIPGDQPVGQSAPPESTGQPMVESASMNVLADNYQEYYSPGGGRGLYPVETHAVSVGTSGDLLAVNLSETDIRLKPGESKKIAITLQRATGINANVTLDLMNRHLEQAFTNCLPDGVTIDGSQSKTLLTGSDSEGYITLKAEKGAATAERQVCAVLASFSINFVMKATYSSPSLFVTVEKETAEK